VVRDATAASLISGSLLWDTTNDRWIAGPLGSEIEIATISGTQTLTNKTIADTNLSTISTANKVSNSATTATNANTANAIVSRDASGNFSAGTITANLTGNASGTAATVTTAAQPAITSVGTLTGLVVTSASATASFNVPVTYVSGALGVGTATPNTVGLIRATNDVIAYYSSDERLKDNVFTISGSLDKLIAIRGVEFDWIPMKGIHENEGHDIGVIAQEIEKVLPELVTTRDNGYKAVKYEKIVALLIESNKELLKRIEALENKIK
jgi:hypothetical protein